MLSGEVPEDLESVLSILVCVGILALLGRLLQTCFLRVCPWFTAYLLVHGLELVLLETVPVRSNAFGYIYFGFQTANLVIACAVCREVYQLALATHPGLAEFGRTVTYWAAAVAVATALVSVSVDVDVRSGQSIIIHRFFTAERTVNMVLLLLLLLVALYLTWFPVKLRRNILIYALGFAMFFALRSVGLLIVNLLPQTQLRVVSNTLLVLEMVCLTFWIFGLRRESEDEVTVTGHRWDPSQTDRLTQQLDSINTALERFSRK